MNIEQLREYCLSKSFTREGLPFDENTLVLYVADKMFALLPLDEEVLKINLKCDPERAVQLREEYPAVREGYHMNKKHWNTILVNEINSKLIYELIDHSYELVYNGLSKKRRKELEFGK
jgi:predicted DNA-binding protein (MmcQ/YjbR family)